MDLRLQGGVRARLGNCERDPERKLAVLAAIWREWEGRTGELAVIDVRQPEKPSVRLR
jgi:cell division septal protein FtsQ